MGNKQKQLELQKKFIFPCFDSKNILYYLSFSAIMYLPGGVSLFSFKQIIVEQKKIYIDLTMVNIV